MPPRQGPARPPAVRPAPPNRSLLDLESTELDNPAFSARDVDVPVFETGSLRAIDIEDWDPSQDSGDERGAPRQGMRQRPSTAQPPTPKRGDRGGRGTDKW